MDPFPLLNQICPHVNECNGCPSMKIDYNDQLMDKSQKIQDFLHPYIQHIEIVPSIKLQFYRNRADFWFSPTQQLGYRKKEDKYETFAASHCQLVSEAAQKIYSFLENKLKQMKFEPYSVLGHKGFLRYVTIRESKTNGQLMVVFNTFTTEKETEMQALANELLSQKLADGVVWVHNAQWNDQIRGEIHHEWGQSVLNETLNGISFAYNTNCFFQTNPKTFEKAHRYVIDLVLPKEPVLDLYSGVGIFSIPLAIKGHLVKGIELSKESIQFARRNMHAVGLDEDILSFEMGDVPKKLKEMEKTNEKFGVIILDPPRTGVSKKIWRRVLRMQPNQIIYVSCNPLTLKRDLQWLEDYAEFSIQNAKIFDFFPHTEHAETIADIRIQKIRKVL